VPESPFVVEFGGRETLRFHFDVVRLWEIPAERVLETPYVDLWPLAGAMAGVTEGSVLAAARQIATAPVEEQERSDLLELLALLAGLRLPARAMLDALRREPMIEDILRHSSVAQALIEEGRDEGLNEGMRESVRLVIEGQLGPLDDELRAAIERADQTTLRVVLAHVATDTPEQLRARLGLG
jgi:hypothetical protein